MLRISIWTHGGIGGGLFSQGQPAIQLLVGKLSSDFDIDVYSMESPDEDFNPSGYRIISLHWKTRARWLRWSYLVWRFAIEHIRRRYRVLYAFWGYPSGCLAVMLGKILGIPSVVHLQGGDAVAMSSLNYGVFISPFRARVCRFLYARSSALVALSKFQAAHLRSNGVSRSPLIVPFGPDLTQFSFEKERFRHPVVRFLHVGNQTPVKGQEAMLKVFASVLTRIPATLQIIGDDFYDGRLKSLVGSLGIESFVTFLGPQPHTLMPEYYHSADILLHTSRYEGQGLVFAEAAACGTLIAGTPVGMLSDMGEECAVLAREDELDSLVSKIVEMVRSKDQWQKLQCKARQWVEMRDFSYSSKKISAILTEMGCASLKRSGTPESNPDLSQT